MRTSYEYDPNRRWLARILTTDKRGEASQDIAYRFDKVGNVEGYTNSAGSYETAQDYEYDDLYQLIGAEGTSRYHPYGINEYTSSYSQDFAYDALGNMTSKISAVSTSPRRQVGDNLNYSYEYSYYPGKAHQAERIGSLYYRYDGNGNVIEEREGGHGSGTVLAGEVFARDELRMTDTGFGISRGGSGGGGEGSSGAVYSRSYVWDEENRLVRSVDANIAADYRYGADGQRAAKYSREGESLYFDTMWSCQTDSGSLRQMKNVYVGETRIATRLNVKGDTSTGYEKLNTYYYHADHLGSAQFVSDSEGKEYERIEYTPYGETWIEKSSEVLIKIPYRFTGKELDRETGLYYYGARYMNPKTSGWLSADPALVEYLPVAPVDDEARERNGSLPGMGGVFNPVNLALYHYAGNNPVKYTDPTGTQVIEDGQSVNTYVDYKVMNQKLIESGMKRLGQQNYVWGGRDPVADGGTDCSGTVEFAIEDSSGISVRDRTAHDIATDARLVVPGDGTPGTLNVYNWDGKGTYDHITINLGNGKEINPFGGTANTKNNPAPIVIKDIPKKKENEVRINIQVNWHYIFFE